MGVIVTNVKRLKKATPKKSPAVTRKKVVPKRKAALKSKPETKTNDITPKPKVVKSKPTPKKKSLKKKPTANNTPAKKEVNNFAPANNVPEKRESRKRVASKIENDVPAKRAVKEKPVAATPAKRKSGRGRPPKANNVISPKKKETPKKTTEKVVESSPVKATNDVKKKQSKSKQVKKSPTKGKKTVATKTPKKTPTVAKSGSSTKVNKARATGRKGAKKSPAAKTKSVYLNPVIELEPIEHFKAMTQVTRDFTINLTRLEQVKSNPRVIIPRLEISSRQGTIINHETPEEKNPLNKKYQPYMEKLAQLTTEEISDFVQKNKDYYAEKLRDTGNIQENSKSCDLKDQFKCYPFNSEQQLAMYLTLRDLFNVPKTHFIECRKLFTVLMPEISCQLFGQIFRVKTSSAPKLIKKLYPSSMSPF